jgi:hypothetical protein
MTKLVVFTLMVIFLWLVLPQVAMAQVGVEYGIIGSSRVPPKCPDCSGKVEKKIQNNFRRTTSSNKENRSKQMNKSQTGGKGSGPLIIEKRGNHYERIN